MHELWNLMDYSIGGAIDRLKMIMKRMITFDKVLQP